MAETEDNKLLAGSAPRVRGTGAQAGVPSAARRFSPARAGNGSSARFSRAASTVQPRACGERPVRPGDGSRRPGSAPRVRGTGVGQRLCRPARRFSPARAGNGDGQPASPGSPAVQPRACGERRRLTQGRAPALGSAPRVRGTVAPVVIPLRRQRFSPARAGNGQSRARIPPAPAVQPRACGERRAKSPRASSPSGSAPRVRGTVQILLQPARGRRFSPARAGNGIRSCSTTSCRPVQPRACGERYRQLTKQWYCGGSAPRVRGTGYL